MTRLERFYNLTEKIHKEKRQIKKAFQTIESLNKVARSLDIKVNWEDFTAEDISKCSIAHDCYFIKDPPDWKYCTTCGKIKPIKE